MKGAFLSEFETPCCGATALLAAGLDLKDEFPLRFTGVICTTCARSYEVELERPGLWREADKTFPPCDDGQHFVGYPAGVEMPKVQLAPIYPFGARGTRVEADEVTLAYQAEQLQGTEPLVGAEFGEGIPLDDGCPREPIDDDDASKVSFTPIEESEHGYRPDKAFGPREPVIGPDGELSFGKPRAFKANIIGEPEEEIECPLCSRAGGADRAVMHRPPICPEPTPLCRLCKDPLRNERERADGRCAPCAFHDHAPERGEPDES